MTLARQIRWIALAGALAAAGCAADRDPGTRGDPEVIGATGAGSSLQRFEVRSLGRLMTVQIFDRGEGRRVVAVSARAPRAMDRADGQLALNAAVEAGNDVDCAGQPLRVIAETGTFQEQGRRGAFTGGEATWIFQAQCG